MIKMAKVTTDVQIWHSCPFKVLLPFNYEVRLNSELMIISDVAKDVHVDTYINIDEILSYITGNDESFVERVIKSQLKLLNT